MTTPEIIEKLKSTRFDLKSEIKRLDRQDKPDDEKAELIQELESQYTAIGEAIEIIKQSAQLTACLRALQSYQETSTNA